MLIEFSVENFLSFKDKVTLSMIASPDKDKPENVIYNAQGTKFNLLKTIAIYGPNASGKSNLIKAYEFILNALTFSKTPIHDRYSQFKHFKLEANCAEKPSLFEISFIEKSVRYDYGFSLFKNEVHEEWFYSYPKGQPRRLMERTLNEESGSHEYYFNDRFFESKKKNLDIAEKTRNDILFMDAANIWNHPIAKIVVDKLTASLVLDTADIYFAALSFLKKLSSDDRKELLDFVETFVRKADTGISKLILFQKVYPVRNNDVGFGLINESENTFNSRDKMSEDHTLLALSQEIQIATEHISTNHDGHSYSSTFDIDEESEGTKELLSLSVPIVLTLKSSSVLFKDELDSRFHTTLSKRIIRLFHDEKQNPNNAQFIFTTHNTDLLDNDLFRRDQIWFVDKDRMTGASELYSLWDFKNVRKKENIQKNYLEGKYGAVPIIDDLAPVFERFEDESKKN